MTASTPSSRQLIDAQSKGVIVRTRILLVALFAVVALVAGACGGSDDDASSSGDTRTIEIEMRDIAFAPDAIAVPAGEDVRLRFHNTGKVDHDAFIGDAAAQADHDEEMNSSDGGMHHGSDDSEAITVEPGDTGTLTHTFEAGDALLIGCHQPGHYKSGMKITVRVT